MLFALALLALAAVMMLATPDRGDAVRPAGGGRSSSSMALFGLFEYTVFNVEFRREGDLVLAVGDTDSRSRWCSSRCGRRLIARLLLTMPVLMFVRRNRSYKLLFNSSLFVFETAARVPPVPGAGRLVGRLVGGADRGDRRHHGGGARC